MAFNPELGSTSPAVLLDNAERLDKLVNGDALTEPDRAGVDLDTWRGMMAKNDEVRKNLIPLSKQYMTIEAAQADIANIPEGSTTYVRSPGDIALALEVINNGGVLEPTWRAMPSQAAVDEISDRIPYVPSPNYKVPLFHDEEDNVGAWFEDGKLNAVALHDDLLAGFLTNTALEIAFVQRTLKTSGKTAWKYRAKKAKLDIGLSSKLKIGFTGDSWTEHSTIPQVFADYFYAKYGKSGDGWIQLNIDNPNQLNGIVLARDGWSVYDASATSLNPTFPTAMDGQYIYATGTAATLSISNLFDTSVQIFYYDGTGTFRYSVNGAVPVVVTGAGTNKIVSVTVSGLNIFAATTLSLDLTGNTGTVVIYGFYANGTGNGVEINKMGNGGITAPQYIKTLSYLSQTGTVVAPDVLIMIIGTNDFRTSITLQAFRDGLTWWLNAWKAIAPDSAIILVAPAQCNASGANPLTSFRDIIRDVAITAGVEFYSLYDFMNTTYAKSNTEGLWVDNLHLSNAGGRFLLNQLNSHFLEQ
ncbi:TPA: hypothetical protein RQO47_001993 [Klebsiella michiganensis]|nr:hypothetical protein [Klebsiella michiganensis]